MTVLDGLRAVRALLSDPARWTQGAAARTRLGRPVGPLELTASCFCLAGACQQAVVRAHIRGDVYEALHESLRSTTPIGGVSIPDFNDAPGRTHAEVLDLLDRTIARLEGAG